MSTFLSFLVLLVGWVCFAFAVMNIISAAYAYCIRKPGSWGLGASFRMLLYSAALAAWYHIVFFIYPTLQ